LPSSLSSSSSSLVPSADTVTITVKIQRRGRPYQPRYYQGITTTTTLLLLLQQQLLLLLMLLLLGVV
jgi:hypothetical protein